MYDPHITGIFIVILKKNGKIYRKLSLLRPLGCPGGPINIFLWIMSQLVKMYLFCGKTFVVRPKKLKFKKICQKLVENRKNSSLGAFLWARPKKFISLTCNSKHITWLRIKSVIHYFPPGAFFKFSLIMKPFLTSRLADEGTFLRLWYKGYQMRKVWERLQQTTQKTLILTYCPKALWDEVDNWTFLFICFSSFFL